MVPLRTTDEECGQGAAVAEPGHAQGLVDGDGPFVRGIGGPGDPEEVAPVAGDSHGEKVLGGVRQLPGVSGGLPDLLDLPTQTGRHGTGQIGPITLGMRLVEGDGSAEPARPVCGDEVLGLLGQALAQRDFDLRPVGSRGNASRRRARFDAKDRSEWLDLTRIGAYGLGGPSGGTYHRVRRTVVRNVFRWAVSSRTPRSSGRCPPWSAPGFVPFPTLLPVRSPGVRSGRPAVHDDDHWCRPGRHRPALRRAGAAVGRRRLPPARTVPEGDPVPPLGADHGLPDVVQHAAGLLDRVRGLLVFRGARQQHSVRAPWCATRPGLRPAPGAQSPRSRPSQGRATGHAGPWSMLPRTGDAVGDGGEPLGSAPTVVGVHEADQRAAHRGARSGGTGRHRRGGGHCGGRAGRGHWCQHVDQRGNSPFRRAGLGGLLRVWGATRTGCEPSCAARALESVTSAAAVPYDGFAVESLLPPESLSEGDEAPPCSTP